MTAAAPARRCLHPGCPATATNGLLCAEHDRRRSPPARVTRLPELRSAEQVAAGLGAEVDLPDDATAPPWCLDPRAVIARRCSMGLRVASLAQAVACAARRVSSASGEALPVAMGELLAALDDLDAASRETLPWIRASMMPRRERG